MVGVGGDGGDGEDVDGEDVDHGPGVLVRPLSASHPSVHSYVPKKCRDRILKEICTRGKAYKNRKD